MKQKKLLVAIDWDEPLKPFKSAFLDFHNRVHGKNLQYDNAPMFDMSAFMGFDSFERYMAHVDEYHAFEMENPQLAVRSDAVSALRNLSDRFDYAVVTTRKNRFKPYTKAQMAMVLPSQTVAVYHLEDYADTHGPKKGRFVKSLGAVVLIDDRPVNITSAVRNGVHGLLFDDQFNIKYRGKAVRVKNWQEIETELSRLYNEMVSTPASLRLKIA